MNKIKTLCVFLLVFLLTIFAASASLQVSDVRLGDSDQVRGETVTVSVTVTNTGSQLVNDLEVSFPGVLSKYNVQGELSSTSIEPDESVTLTVEGFVTLDLHAVDTRGRKTAMQIGDVLVSGHYEDGTPVSRRAKLLMEAENRLMIGTGSKITYDDSTRNLRDGREYTNVRRGDLVEFEVEARNMFSTGGDCQEESRNCDIRNIEIFAYSSYLDIDDDTSMSTLRADRRSTRKMAFVIDDDADDGGYDVDLWMTGRDENGARHGDNWVFFLEVNVPRNEVLIRDMRISRAVMDCDRRATLTVTLKNTGYNDQSRVALLLESPRLGIKEEVLNIRLNSDNEITRTFNLELSSNIPPGEYYIVASTYIDRVIETDRQAVMVELKNCYTQPSNQTGTNPPDVNLIDIPPTAGVIYGKPKQVNFFDSAEYVILLGALFVVALLLVLVLAVVLVRK
jgi:hypothetical protein